MLAAGHPLDRPVWNALAADWAGLAFGDGGVRWLDPDYGPFAAVDENTPGSILTLIEELATDRFVDRALWLVEREPVGVAEAGIEVRYAECHQMVAEHVEPEDVGFEVSVLTEEDAPEMLELALLTRPGPFAKRTNRLSEFIGVKERGRLVAMAGERMRCHGYSEVSGVCTHPDYRGRGYAAGLMRLVAGRILARGEVPFLHTYATNEVAIALYRCLGFRYRASVVLTVLKRGAG